MFFWANYDRGQLSLRHAIPIPQKGIHTVRAVPQVINSLLNKVDPSLRELTKWTNQYYEANNLNIRQIIDGDILQVLNGIHLSGLLLQMGIGGEVLTLPDTEEDQDQDKREDGESSSASDTHDSDVENNDEKEGDARGDPSSSE